MFSMLRGYRFLSSSPTLLMLAVACASTGDNLFMTDGAEGRTDESTGAQGSQSDEGAMPGSVSGSTDSASMEDSSLATSVGTDASESTGLSDSGTTGDETGGETVAVGSPGCGSGTGLAGEFQAALPGGAADYTVVLPPGYDGTTPLPLIFGFHGRNRTHIQFRDVDANQIRTEMEPRAVMVYPKSQVGPGWNFTEEVQPNVDFFEVIHARMLAEYCVDTTRTFAIGHSSGGYFSHILACRFGDRLRGIGVVAGARQEQNCVGGEVAAMLIHGVTDTVVSFASGQQARDQLLAVNSCSPATQPGMTSPCIAYEGCDAEFPIEWCEHTEPTYLDEQNQPTNHGWPSFASRAIGQFLFALP